MKLSEVVIGEVYIAKVSGREVPVRLLEAVEPSGWKRIRSFRALNLKTQREVRLTAAKLRRKAPATADDHTFPDSATSQVPCTYCGHPFAAHTTQYQGFWKCAHPSRCVCVMFKDGDFPVPVTSWNLK